MNFWEITLLSLSLSVDSLVVSMSGSLSLGHPRISRILSSAGVFALFQALLLFLGWIAGVAVASLVDKLAHIVGFAILLYLGVSAILSALNEKQQERVNLKGAGHLAVAAVATSIDAFAVGASLAMSEVSSTEIFMLVASVGFVTFAASGCGIRFGALLGRKFGRPAKLAGGLVLILIGLKLLF